VTGHCHFPQPFATETRQLRERLIERAKSDHALTLGAIFVEEVPEVGASRKKNPAATRSTLEQENSPSII